MDSKLLTQLFEVSRRMAETRDLYPLLNFAMETALQLFNAERGYLVLLNDDDTLDFHVKIDRHGEEIEQPEGQISTSIFHKVVSENKPIVTTNAMDEHPSTSALDLKLRSVMCVPLTARDKVIGALYVENRNEGIFAKKDAEPMQLFANMAAVSIENAMLNAEVESLLRQRAEELRLIGETLHDRALEHGNMDKNALREALERERMRVMANFIQDASHHFRTPLAIINTNVDIMQRKMGDNLYERYFNAIQSQVLVIDELVDTLNYMVNLDSVMIDHVTTLDLNSIARDMQAVKLPIAENKSIIMTLQAADEPIAIEGRLDFVRQALGRILDNAITFTPDNGEVKLRIFAEDDYRIIEVMDNGAGIEKGDLPSIFQRFYRSDKAGTTRGFGLGLSIAQRIMDLHDGFIYCDSEPGKGSIFRMIFPKGE